MNNNYTKTGVFVLTGIFLLGICIYVLGSDESIFAKRTRVYSYFDDTQGLLFGSIVSFSGINIGNVKEIRYDDQKKSLRVEYSIKKSFLPYIKTDSKAQLKTQGALGDRFIFITSGSVEAKGIQPGAMIESSNSGDIFEAVQEKIDGIPDLEAVGKELEKLMVFLNSDEGLKGTVKELKKTIPEIRATVRGYNQGKDVKKAVKQLNSILAKVEKGEGSLGKLISDPSLYNKINGMLGGSSPSNYLKKLGRKSIESQD